MTGAKGVTGAKGPTGLKGPTGAKGATGAKGVTGATGPSNPTLVTGAIFTSGVGPAVNSTITATATCGVGTKLLGGGAQVTHTGALRVAMLQSFPSSANVWTAVGVGHGGLRRDHYVRPGVCALPVGAASHPRRASIQSRLFPQSVRAFTGRT